MVTDYKVIKILISTPLSKKIFVQMTKTVRILNTILLKRKMSKKNPQKNQFLKICHKICHFIIFQIAESNLKNGLFF